MNRLLKPLSFALALLLALALFPTPARAAGRACPVRGRQAGGSAPMGTIMRA